MKITREEVERVAQLAHLELSPKEAEMYQGQLDAILTYIDKLKQLDVSKVEPMYQVHFDGSGHTNPFRTQSYGADTHTHPDGTVESAHSELRNDELRPCGTAEALFGQSSGAAKPFFRVPKVIER